MSKDMKRKNRRELDKMYDEYKKHLKSGEDVSKPKVQKKKFVKNSYAAREMDF